MRLCIFEEVADLFAVLFFFVRSLCLYCPHRFSMDNGPLLAIDIVHRSVAVCAWAWRPSWSAGARFAVLGNRVSLGLG